ncbi:Adhesion G-protein coupled receptor D1 [Trichoplax sp. H2]|nr:Adhesion G-protein coupled receptor D1 [Trichoplax sp. H2]|eukprot:RDD37702.1 Adhesion G-protein coupled receptor D1 [Trichoplax sp. H2]
MGACKDCCPTGWKSHEDRCFKLVNATSSYETFDNANTACKNLYPGAQLTYVDSASVSNFIKTTFLTGQTSDFIYIGLKDMTGADTDSSHIWIQTGKSIAYYGYDNWYYGAPYWKSRKCVSYRRTSGATWRWRDVDCAIKYPFICDIAYALTITDATTAATTEIASEITPVATSKPTTEATTETVSETTNKNITAVNETTTQVLIETSTEITTETTAQVTETATEDIEVVTNTTVNTTLTATGVAFNFSESISGSGDQSTNGIIGTIDPLNSNETETTTSLSATTETNITQIDSTDNPQVSDNFTTEQWSNSNYSNEATITIDFPTDEEVDNATTIIDPTEIPADFNDENNATAVSSELANSTTAIKIEETTDSFNSSVITEEMTAKITSVPTVQTIFRTDSNSITPSKRTEIATVSDCSDSQKCSTGIIPITDAATSYVGQTTATVRPAIDSTANSITTEKATSPNLNYSESPQKNESTLFPATISGSKKNISFVLFETALYQLKESNQTVNSSYGNEVLISFQRSVQVNNNISCQALVNALDLVSAMITKTELICGQNTGQTRLIKNYFQMIKTAQNYSSDKERSEQMAVISQSASNIDALGLALTQACNISQSLSIQETDIDMEVIVEPARYHNNHQFTKSIISTSLNVAASLNIPKLANSFDVNEKLVIVSGILRFESYFGNVTVNGSKEILSAILLCTINPTPRFEADQNFVYNLSHKAIESSLQEVVCVFWDTKSHTWSQRGCVAVARSRTYTVCQCNHLTHFALMVQPIKQSTKDYNNTRTYLENLDLITVIGMGCSIFFIFLTLAVYTLLRLNSERFVVHKNLLVALLLAQGTLMLAMNVTKYQVACKITSILLHFFYLAAFSWMMVEGIHLYFVIIAVFNQRSKMKFYLSLGWGLPLLIVGVTSMIRFEDYGINNRCWLSYNHGMIWSFITPIGVIFIINLITMALVIRIAVNSSTSVAGEKVKKCSYIKAKSIVKATAILFPILGVTWVFGLIPVSPDTIMFSYIFVVLNSLQGVFIFIFHCVLNSEVKSVFKVVLRRKNILTSLQHGPDNYNSSPYPSKPSKGRKIHGDDINKKLDEVDGSYTIENVQKFKGFDVPDSTTWESHVPCL